MYWYKRKFLHKLKVHLPHDWFGTTKWPPFRTWRDVTWNCSIIWLLRNTNSQSVAILKAAYWKNMRKKIRPLEGQKYFTSNLFRFWSNFLPPTIFFNFSGCQEGSSVQDQCGQRCTCTGGQLVNCVRIRKEFTDMTLEERRLYIKTIKTASTDPRFKTDYDNLLNSHRILFLSGLCTPLMPLVTV